MTLRLLIIDDHALFREGLIALITRSMPDAAIREAGSLAEAASVIEQDSRAFDFVLLDLKLQGLGAQQVAAQAIPMFADTPVVVLSGESDSRLVRNCIELGAMGFIPKSLSFADFSSALARSLAGEVYLPQADIADGLKLMQKGDGAPPLDVDSANAAIGRLSHRQLEILRLLVYGMSNKSIAKRLGLSDTTVKTHLQRIFPLLDVHSREEAVYLLAQVEHSIGRNRMGRQNDSVDEI